MIIHIGRKVLGMMPNNYESEQVLEYINALYDKAIADSDPELASLVTRERRYVKNLELMNMPIDEQAQAIDRSRRWRNKHHPRKPQDPGNSISMMLMDKAGWDTSHMMVDDTRAWVNFSSGNRGRKPETVAPTETAYGTVRFASEHHRGEVYGELEDGIIKHGFYYHPESNSLFKVEHVAGNLWQAVELVSHKDLPQNEADE